MDANKIIDRLKEDIYDVLSHYIDLKPNGNKYKGCCPLHGEKTPSFYVTPHMGIYKCFGCGKSGDTIQFIMEHEGVGFKEAVEIGAKKLNIDFLWTNSQNFNTEEYKHQQSLKILCNKAAQCFVEQLKSNEKALDFIKDRNILFDDDNVFKIGFAPAGNTFIEYATKEGLNLNLAEEAGLIKTSSTGKYDTFRDRIIFPLCNKNGQVTGFTGRTILQDKKIAKYLNTSDTTIFQKGEILFGLNIARGTIKKVDRAYLVEGNTDVIRLNKIGIINTIAGSGTALTKQQIELLHNYTNKVTLIYDGDKAGTEAMNKNAENLIKNQFFVSVIILPDKQDPDSYFKTIEIFDEANNESQDYIIHKVTINKEKCKNPIFKSELIKDTAALVAYYEEPSKQEVYIEAASQILKPKKLWQDSLATFVADKTPVERKFIIPPDINLSDYYDSGFYASQRCYYFADKKGKPEKQSNFTMTPLFHIESTLNAKRLYEVTNTNNITKVIELPQRDLISIAAFKLRVESLGNFLWTGSEADLNKLKAWLYANTASCKEITQLGWQKEGFFAWGNGIFNGKFTEIDKFGIVPNKGINYYIPAKSSIYKEEPNLFQFERNFIHMEGNITLREYFLKFVDVFGNNGKVALSFLIASIFRDIGDFYNLTL